MPRMGRRIRPGIRQSLRFQMESGDFPVPVLFLKFGENTGTEAKDSSPEGNDMDIEGPTWTTGFKGPGLDFDDIDDYGKISDSASFSALSAITLAAWMYQKGLGDFHTILEQDEGYVFRTDAFDYLKFWVHLGAAGWKLVASSIEAVVKISPIERWFFVVGTWESGEGKVYINAVERGSTTQTGSMNDGGDLIIGANAAKDSNLMKGILDEVRIYDVAFSARQVRELFYGFE